MKRKPPFRNNKIHVVDRLCDTCIFRSGNLMELNDGRVEDMTAQALSDDSAIICHSTLGGAEAVCRGFFNKHAQDVLPLRLALAMGVIQFTPILEH